MGQSQGRQTEQLRQLTTSCHLIARQTPEREIDEAGSHYEEALLTRRYGLNSKQCVGSSA